MAVLSATSWLSSTTRTLRLVAASAAQLGAEAAVFPRAAAASSVGRRMTNSLPWPGPLLYASIVPLCISTSRVANVKSHAESTLGLYDVALTLHEQIEDLPQQMRRYPHAVVVHADQRPPGFPPDRHMNAATLGRVLLGVVQQIRHDLSEAGGVAVHP